MNNAELAAIEKRLRANKPKRVNLADGTVGTEQAQKLAVNGGFRAGKRKRGTSLLKKAPKAQAHAVTYYLRDEYGTVRATVRTLTYKRET